MKNFIFKSHNDSTFIKLEFEIIKRQNRELRQDMIDIKARLTRLITASTGQTTIVREEEYPEEELHGTTEDNRDGN